MWYAIVALGLATAFMTDVGIGFMLGVFFNEN